MSRTARIKQNKRRSAAYPELRAENFSLLVGIEKLLREPGRRYFDLGLRATARQGHRDPTENRRTASLAL